jgi:hypothetical protein
MKMKNYLGDHLKVQVQKTMDAINSIILDKRRISATKKAETLAIPKKEWAILFTIC